MSEIQPSDNVGSVLNSVQMNGSSAVMLGYSKDTRSFTQQSALEVMVSNEELAGMHKTLVGIKKSMEMGFIGIMKAMTRGQVNMLSNSGSAMRDVTPMAPMPSKQLAISGTAENDNRSHAQTMMTMFGDMVEGTKESAFHLRNLDRDIGLIMVRGLPDRDVTPKFTPTKKTDKPTEYGKFGSGILGYLADVLGLSEELAPAWGALKKLFSAVNGTFKNIGTAMDNTVKFGKKVGGGVSDMFSKMKEYGGKAKGMFNYRKLNKTFGGIGTRTKLGWRGLKRGTKRALSTGKTGKFFAKVGEGIEGSKALVGRFTKPFTSAFSKMIKPITKFAGKIFEPLLGSMKWLIKPFEKIGAGLLAKGAGLTFAKAIPVIGWVLAAVMAIKDGADALGDSKAITGKSKEFQTLGNKVNVFFSGILSGLTLGFISTKTIYTWANKIEGWIGSGIDKAMGLMPTAVQDALKGLWGQMFDSEHGIFGGIGKIMEGTIEKMGNGQWLSVLEDMTFAAPKMIFSMVKRSIEKIDNLFTGNGTLMKDLGDWVMDLLKSVKDWAINGVKNLVTHPLDTAKAAGSAITDGAKSAWSATTGAVKGVGSHLWEQLSDENAGLRTARVFDVNKRKDQINEMLAKGDVKGARATYKELQSFVAKNSIAGDAKFKDQISDSMSIAANAIQTGMPQTKGKMLGDVDETMVASKAQMNRKSDQQPIVVNPVVQMPEQSSPKQRVNRSTEGSMDRGIAFANYTGS